MQRMPLWLAVLVPGTLAAQSNVPTAVGTITAEDFLQRVGVIAHDSMRGRNTPSPGLELTAAWIADEMRGMGLAPGGDRGSYLQRYPLHETRLDLSTSGIHVWSGDTWRFGSDALVLLGSATGPSGVSGPTVVLSGVPVDPSLPNLDVEGAVVFLAAGERGPALVRPVLAQGAAAAVLVGEMPDRVWAQWVEAQRRVSLAPSWGDDARGDALVLHVKPKVAAGALAANGFDLEAALADPSRPLTARYLSGLNVTINLNPETVRALTAPNVVGMLEGRDPLLRSEYVVFSGHMDHVGAAGDPHASCRAGESPDRICNGADDDASGTVAVVQLARAFSTLRPRPRRSLLFLLVSGEEQGLWGSDFFSEHPPVPLDRMVANVNADMIGRNWRDTIVAIGREHSDLGETLERVSAAHPELRMAVIDDPWPQERFYFRSDHYNFARKGVPILFFFNGTHADYHQTSDEVARLDGGKAARIVKLLFHLGLELTTADDRPRWYPRSYREIVTRR